MTDKTMVIVIGLPILGMLIGLTIVGVSSVLDMKYETSWMGNVIWAGVGLMGLSTLVYVIGAFMCHKT